MADGENIITAIPGKAKDFFYPRVPLTLPTEQSVLKNGKVYPMPPKPAPNFGPDYTSAPEHRGAPVKNYEVTDIQQPSDLYVAPYGEHKEAGRINMRSAMVARRKHIHDLMNKYPQNRTAGRNVDQDILNSRFLPILDPMAGRSDIDALRDYYRKGGDYSKPVATVKSRGSLYGVAHAHPQEHVNKAPLVNKVSDKLMDRQEIFPGIVSKSMTGALGREYNLPGSILISPTQGSPYGQTLAFSDPATTAQYMRRSLAGGKFGPDFSTDFRLTTPAVKDQADNRIHRLVRRHDTGHVNAPYFTSTANEKSLLYPSLRGRDVKEFDQVMKDRRYIDGVYEDVVGPRISQVMPLSNDVKDEIATHMTRRDAPGLLRGAYFNLPDEATGAFNQWKSNYAVENNGATAPRTLDGLIQEEIKRGAIYGPKENMRTDPHRMYSKGHTADWSSGIDGILRIRSAVHRAVLSGKMSKEEADKILKRMNDLYRMSRNTRERKVIYG